MTGASDRIEMEHALIAGTADLNNVVDYLENCILSVRIGNVTKLETKVNMPNHGPF